MAVVTTVIIIKVVSAKERVRVINIGLVLRRCNLVLEVRQIDSDIPLCLIDVNIDAFFPLYKKKKSTVAGGFFTICSIN